MNHIFADFSVNNKNNRERPLPSQVQVQYDVVASILSTM